MVLFSSIVEIKENEHQKKVSQPLIFRCFTTFLLDVLDILYIFVIHALLLLAMSMNGSGFR